MTREATGLKHCVPRGVTEQVVDFLKPVEVEAEHSKTFALGQGGDFLVDPPVEMATIGQRCQRVVMCEIVDMLFCLFARLQIANSDDVMGPSGKNDRPQDQLDRGYRAVEMVHIRFNRQVGSWTAVWRAQPCRENSFRALHQPDWKRIGRSG